ncbi:GntR family transcriptional regulator [Neobacillus notoginsengisoli]|uniref:GntR family transcriptional regulator n=1 Tax=Neobacillus notoginsengisoli TaxID=1578198 RepID=A0A417YYP5_9BACI|nr:GntR family transcriptional regulator [Neobacillus notoginsengisoli]RHW42834.1 GntR family transcriptional regulator [Neobacillus notoginsengisoli]
MNKNKSNKLKRPLYVNVYDELLLLISKGEFPVDTRLPSEPDLAKSLGVSRATLRQALALLQDDGLIRNIHGKGNFVIDSLHNEPSEIRLEKLTNPMHKCHISSFDRVDIQSYWDPDTEYTKQVLKRDSSKVAAIDRFYYKEKDLVGYAFTFLSLETAEELGLDLDNNELLLDYLENQAYKDAIQGDIEIKYTQTVNIASRKDSLLGRKNCFLLMESLYSNANSPIMFSKFYIPQQFAQIKVKAFK